MQERPLCLRKSEFPMLLLADLSLQELLQVQGLHALLPHLYITGNRPDPSWESVLFGLASGLVWLLVALLASLRLRRREGAANWSAARARVWRLLVVLGFFVCWEASLQVWSAQNPNETYVADPVTFWAGRPMPTSSQLSVQRLEGLFDGDYPFERTPGRYRIMFLGDSQAISVQPQRYGGPRTYPKVLAALEYLGPAGEPLETINAAISGYTSWQGLLLLRNLGLEYHPDLVVAAFGYHDSAQATSPDSQVMTDDPRIHRLRTLLYRSRIYLLIRKLALRRHSAAADRDPGSLKVPRVSVPEFEANLRAMADLGRRHGFRLAVFLEPFRDDHVGVATREYREAARRVAGQEGLAILDVFTPVAEMDPVERESLFDDDIHLRASGHRRLAHLVAEELTAAGLLRRGSSEGRQDTASP